MKTVPEIRINRSKPLAEEPGTGHNRWHPDIPPDHGNGIVREPRLYQLIRHSAPVKDRAFEIELLHPGATAFSFTFG